MLISYLFDSFGFYGNFGGITPLYIFYYNLEQLLLDIFTLHQGYLFVALIFVNFGILEHTF